MIACRVSSATYTWWPLSVRNRAIGSRCTSAVQTNTLRRFREPSSVNPPPLKPSLLSRLASKRTASSTEELSDVSRAWALISKAGAAVGCSKRRCSVEGDPPTASALCSNAGELAAPVSLMLLHFGQRTVKGRAGAFSSSICRRVEHFWQTMIMALSKEKVF